MAATSARHTTGTATASATHAVLPGCSRCGSAMVIRAQWHGGRVNGLMWTCRRAPGCEGTQRIRNPETIQPFSLDASTQAIFDWQRSHDPSLLPRREPMATPAGAGLRGLFGRMSARPAAEPTYEAEPVDAHESMGYFDGLVEHGFVALDERSLPAARAMIDTLLIGPSGVFVVEYKAWAGQVSTTTDSVYVDGRQRVGATDDIVAATKAIEQTLQHELKPLGVSVKAAILFERATNRSLEGKVGTVIVGGTRGLPKSIRGTADPVLGPETILRLALAADRLLD